MAKPMKPGRAICHDLVNDVKNWKFGAWNTISMMILNKYQIIEMQTILARFGCPEIFVQLSDLDRGVGRHDLNLPRSGCDVDLTFD